MSETGRPDEGSRQEAERVVGDQPTVLVVDFGAQYAQLIARRVREANVYSEIVPHSITAAELARRDPAAIIFSGGPKSVRVPDAPSIDPGVYDLGVPILGICYGQQLIAQQLGGEVGGGGAGEYGRTVVHRSSDVVSSILTDDLPADQTVWMSHFDAVQRPPEGFVATASSEGAPCAVIEAPERRIWGVQYHPEVAHTPHGQELITRFLHDLAGLPATWTMENFIDASVEAIRAQVGDGRAICGLSGGVDSSVAAALIHRAIGERLTCIFVDNGLLRKGEREQVAAIFRDHFHVDLRVIDAEERFLAQLSQTTDPEKKRKIIGYEFIAVFDEQAKTIQNAKFLAQGTLYPDVIESVSFKGPSHTIKSHHNVGGLPERMQLSLVEPLRELFKDEVRQLGLELGLPRHMVWRQPFPGPGLAVRCLGNLNRERLDVLRAADAIIEEEIRAAGLYESIWQSFGVLLPVKSVGVMGDARTYEETLAVRAVHSRDGMTADWVQLPYDVLGRISSRIINEVRGINRVVYDITSKPPGSIEWE